MAGSETVHYLNFNSKFRPYIKGEQEPSNDFTITLPNPIYNVTSIQPISAIFPVSEYTIRFDESNNKFKIRIGTDEYVVRIPVGTYQGAEAEQAVNTLLENGIVNPNNIIQIVNQAIVQTRNANPAWPATLFVELVYIVPLRRYAFRQCNRALNDDDQQLPGAIANIEFELDFDVDPSLYIYETFGWTMGFEKSYYSKNFKKDVTYGSTSCQNTCLGDLNQGAGAGLTGLADACKNLRSKNINGISQYKMLTSDNDTTLNEYYIAEKLAVMPATSLYYLMAITDFTNSGNNPFIEACLPSNAMVTSDVIAKIPTNYAELNTTSQDDGSPLNLQRVYKNPVTLSKLRIRLYDETLRSLDINNGDYSFMLQVTTIENSRR
jgi:hypothetical protein